MVDRVHKPPWPAGPMVLLLDEITEVTIEDVAALEDRKTLCVAALKGKCEGASLAAAFAVDLLVAAASATFGRPGAWSDIVIRRGIGIAGRRVMAYLAMTDRTIDAHRARGWGIVSLIDEDPVAAAVKQAEDIAKHSPAAVETILRQCHQGAFQDYIVTRLTGDVR